MVNAVARVSKPQLTFENVLDEIMVIDLKG
jgi:hypothetical protein